MKSGEEDICEQCTCLPERVVDCLQTSSSDIPQSLPLNGMPMPAKSCENDPQKGGFQSCKCGKETLGCSIHPNTPDEWIASMQDSLARILASPEIKQGLALKQGVASTVKSSASLAWFDRDSCSWKMSQQSFLTDSEQSLQTWPRSGMTLNGYVYELPTVARRITGIGGGAWPTPDTKGFVNEGSLAMLGKKCETLEEMNAMAHRAAASKKAKHFPTPTVTSGAQVAWDKTPGQTGGTTLAGYVKYWPTPTSHDAKDTGTAPSEGERNTPNLAYQAGGKLNPTWVEWLMAWPLGFTDSKHWATVKSRSKRQSRGNS